MTKTFFTSDLHFFHNNIIKYCNRPFKDSYEMNFELVKKWNSKVPKDGLVYILGDISMNAKVEEVVKILGGLNGDKVLITGNHDSHLLKEEAFRNCFIGIYPIREIYVQDKELEDGRAHITLCHYAMKVWNKSHHGAWHLYGHWHGTVPDEGTSMDVGVDTNEFYPYSYEEIKIKLWKISTNQIKQSKQLSLDF